MNTNELKYSELTIDRLKEALDMITDVFYEYNAKDYSEQGIREFTNFIDFDWHKNRFEERSYIDDESDEEGGVFIRFYDEFRMWICEDTGNDKIIGVLATYGAHLYWMFVDGKYHRRGIARKLFDIMVENIKPHRMTVCASPYAVEVYRKLGFVDSGDEQNEQGLRVIPMVYTSKGA